jgi:hypothetical protein
MSPGGGRMSRQLVPRIVIALKENHNVIRLIGSLLEVRSLQS